MSSIQIMPVQNGWLIRPDDGLRYEIMPFGGVQVARTPKELCELVDVWAKAEGKPGPAKSKS